MVRKLSYLMAFVAFSASALLAQESADFPEGSVDAEANKVVLRTLDKITARITEIEVAIGSEAQIGTLYIKPLYCRTRPPIEPPETFAYLEIDDLNRQGGRDRVYEGWMVASTPALNPLEHPVYDVWVINCKMTEGGAPADN